MIYPSKRDSWMTTVLATAAMSMITLACHYMFASNSPTSIIAVFLLGSALFTIWVLHDTNYELGPSALVIHCGPLVKAISVDSIHEIYPTDEPSSAPALSLDRLCVSYVTHGKHRNVLISPERQLHFLRTLAEQVPALRLEGTHAVHESHLQELACTGLVVA